MNLRSQQSPHWKSQRPKCLSVRGLDIGFWGFFLYTGWVSWHHVGTNGVRWKENLGLPSLQLNEFMLRFNLQADTHIAHGIKTSTKPVIRRCRLAECLGFEYRNILSMLSVSAGLASLRWDKGFDCSLHSLFCLFEFRCITLHKFVTVSIKLPPRI